MNEPVESPPSECERRFRSAEFCFGVWGLGFGERCKATQPRSWSNPLILQTALIRPTARWWLKRWLVAQTLVGGAHNLHANDRVEAGGLLRVAKGVFGTDREKRGRRRRR